ncbi:MAG TPA: roadblock/LC7 domain-containing protein [Candidatus Acidoferrum sp.]|nr:roadblock/LC7 domain-containing protein [Candidatus Acidoferrum sp.]
MALPQLIAEDVRELDRLLGELISRSEASSAMIIDKAGFLITESGSSSSSVDTTTLAALAAGSFAATQGMASIVSESNFNCVYQQGESFSLIVQNIEHDTLLVVVFAAHVSVGAVKYFANSAAPKVAEQLGKARERGDGELDLAMMNMENSSEFFRKVAGKD